MPRPKRICTLEKCERPHRSRGYCNMHLQRMVKNGAIPGGPVRNWMRTYDDKDAACSITGCVKIHYSSGMCKTHYSRAKAFRLTCMQLDMLSRVTVCSICLRTESFTNMHIDHDHSCCSSRNWTCGNCVRGLICKKCNLGLGHFDDSMPSLQRAIDYLNAS